MAATNSEPPMYRAMFEMPEAWPTWSAGTADVEADEAGPLERPSPAAITASGTMKAAYAQDAWTNARTPKPIAESPKPATIASRVPILTAIGVISGVTRIIAAAAGRVAKPVSSALMPKALGFWK